MFFRASRMGLRNHGDAPSLHRTRQKLDDGSEKVLDYGGSHKLWFDNHGHLISMAHMLRFSAPLYLKLISLMEQSKNDGGKNDFCAIRSTLNLAEPLLGTLGLSVCLDQVKNLQAMLVYGSPDPIAVNTRICTMIEGINAEMEKCIFFVMPNSRASWYNACPMKILGDACCSRFQKSGVTKEIKEAGNAFAFGLYTACAFHLMRISEAGVHAMGKAAGVKIGNNPNWGNIFKDLNSEQSKPKTARNAAWQTHGEFLEDIAADLRAVKDAWRNPTMHLERDYSEVEATHLLQVIPSFMRKISSKINEDGAWIP